MKDEKGQILIISIVFISVLFMLGTALLGFVGQNVVATRNALYEEQAIQLAEAGIDKAIWSLNETAGSYSGEVGTVLGIGAFDVEVTVVSSSEREVVATGYVPDKEDPRRIQKVAVDLSIDTTNVSFNYGVQVGEGGLVMDNNSTVDGNVYSNGMIDGGSGARIKGDAFSAGPDGRLTDRLIIDGNAHAHQIDNGIQVGGSAFGQIMDDLTVGGTVFTNSISNCTVGGDANYTTISSCSVGGSENPGYPGEDDPEPLDFPISDDNILDWKDAADGGGLISSDYSLGNGATATLGPKHITGNMTISNNAVLTLTGPIWVEGSLEISNGATVKLDPAYADGSEVIISDGLIDVSNNAVFQGASENSFILIISMSASDDAFQVANNADALIAFAPNGTIDVLNNAILREVTGWKIDLANNSEIIYETGLANVNFTSGPGASWQPVRGTWRELN